MLSKSNINNHSVDKKRKQYHFMSSFYIILNEPKTDYHARFAKV